MSVPDRVSRLVRRYLVRPFLVFAPTWLVAIPIFAVFLLLVWPLLLFPAALIWVYLREFVHFREPSEFWGWCVSLSGAMSLFVATLATKKLAGEHARARQTERKCVERETLKANVCPRCRYSLIGLTSPRCPECGTELDRDWFRRAFESTVRESLLARSDACREMVEQMDLGDAAQRDGQYEAAANHLSRAFEIVEEAIRPEEWPYKRILHKLIEALANAGRFAEMEAQSRKAIEHAAKHPASGDLDEVAFCLSCLGNSIEQQARQAARALQTDENAELFAQDGDRVRVYREPGPDIIMRYAEAERVYRDALAKRLRTRSIRVFDSYRCVAEMLVAQARMPEAERVLLDAFEWYQKNIHIRDSETLWLHATEELQQTVLAYGRLLGATGRYSECLPRIGQALVTEPTLAFTPRLRSMREFITTLIGQNK